MSFTFSLGINHLDWKSNGYSCFFFYEYKQNTRGKKLKETANYDTG